ncbi:DnaD domain protein [Listeria cornellensis]|uniref:DNA-binding protein n=1 Tax=Listeria cornellensis FSL F6-0969 TaxID=1265820 RepID=W7BRQ0_9LIST|nr:DnaD domain protein [Listeria cornellensis]EUJ27355.1 DNA-binding protein [Listeria cornellensis FSL F6-0969]
MNINYLKEINAFHDWLEINPISSTTQSLWFHIMNIANKCSWPSEFTIANPTLQAKLGISRGTLNEHRNILVQKGRIQYKSLGRNKAGVYKLILFYGSNNELVKGSSSIIEPENNPNPTPHQPEPLPLVKLNKNETKQTVENPFMHYQKKMGRDLSGTGIQKLMNWIELDKMPEDLINYAIDITAQESSNPKKRKTNPENYIDGILKNWARDGIRTLDAAISENKPDKVASGSDFDSILEKLKEEAAAGGANAGI